MSSSDGYEYTPQAGIRKGLSTIAAIEPSELNADAGKVYDVIVVGAGYAGLTAARDLAVRGKDTLLLEGRDRIGGRTFTVYEHGKPWELGGTWVHWCQPFVWREIVQYGFDNKLQDSLEVSSGSSKPTTIIDGKRKEREWDDEVMASVLSMVCDYDGMRGATAFGANATPPSFIQTEAFKELDKLSLQDRIDQLNLNADQVGVLRALVAMMAKGEPKDIALSELVRWFALSGGTNVGLAFATNKWKFTDGQAAFARAIWDDSVSTGNLSYKFSTPAKSITNKNGRVIVGTSNGEAYVARKIICTIPLNVLKDIQFEPALDPIKAEAIQRGHNNLMIKMYAEVKGKQWRNWMSLAHPSPGFALMIGEGFSKAGNSLILTTVSNEHVEPSKDPSKACELIRALDPSLDVVRLLGNDWCSDPFSQGGWCFYEPGFITKYLEKLQDDAGDVIFANSDWANLWRGFIDGAMEQGQLAATKAIRDLS